MPRPDRPNEPEPSPGFTIKGEGERLALEGVLDIRTLTAAKTSLKQSLRQHKSRTLNIGKLDGIDTPGALFLCGLRAKGVELTGVRAEHKSLLDLICGLDLKPLPKPRTNTNGVHARKFCRRLAARQPTAMPNMHASKTVLVKNVRKRT